MTEPITVTPEAQIITAQKNIASLLNVLHKADGTGAEAQPPTVSVGHVLWPRHAINAHTGELHEKPMRDLSTGRAKEPDSMAAARLNFASARERAFFIHVLKALLPKSELPIELSWNNGKLPASLLILERILELLANKEELNPHELGQLAEIAQDFSSPLNDTSVLPTGLPPLLPRLRKLGCSVTTRPGLPHGDTLGASVVAEVEFDQLLLLGKESAPKLTIQSFVGKDGENYTFVALDSGTPLAELPDTHALEMALGNFQFSDMHTLSSAGFLPHPPHELLRPQFPENRFAQATTACFTGRTDDITLQLEGLIAVVGNAFSKHIEQRLPDINTPGTRSDLPRSLQYRLNKLTNPQLHQICTIHNKNNQFGKRFNISDVELRHLSEETSDPTLTKKARQKAIELVKRYLTDPEQKARNITRNPLGGNPSRRFKINERMVCNKIKKNKKLMANRLKVLEIINPIFAQLKQDKVCKLTNWRENLPSLPEPHEAPTTPQYILEADADLRNGFESFR